MASFSWWILVSSGLQVKLLLLLLLLLLPLLCSSIVIITGTVAQGIMTLLMGQLQGPSDVDNMQMQMTMGMNAQGPQDMTKVRCAVE